MAISDDALANAAALLAVAIVKKRTLEGSVDGAASEAATIFGAVLNELQTQQRASVVTNKVPSQTFGRDR